ncbi:MAG: AraC family transcriptional regulator [Lachnospiraceae bacterium]|nr:AraC family transcriptional regulator [Lachnospiraceae bacterium]
MFDLFEQSDSLNRPIECFEFHYHQDYFPIKTHWHYYMEILYIIEGSAVVTSEEERYELTSGEMILIPPKKLHAILSDNPGALVMIGLKFDIGKLQMTPRYAPKLKSIFRSAESKKMRTHFTKEEAEKMFCPFLFRECLNEIRNQAYGYDLFLRVNICKLLMKVLRLWQTEGFQIDADTFALDERYTVDSITEYIDAHINENLKVAELARECGMSYSYFAKSFLKMYGKSCKEYIEYIRILKVEDYLLFTDFDLTYISQETGFSDCSHLIKSFKGFKGETPAQYRRNRVEKGI